MQGVSKLVDSSQFNFYSEMPRSPLKRKRTAEVPSSHLSPRETFGSKRFRVKTSQIIKTVDEKIIFVTNRDARANKILDNLTFKLKDQVILITKSLPFQSFPSEIQAGIKRFMAEIAVNDTLTEDDKWAELGVLYYYLVCNKNIPENLYLLDERISVIEKELKNLKSTHKSQCPKRLQLHLPSGCHAYLFRAFARMIFTPDGQFNPGGCHAVIKMASSRLAKYYDEEDRIQIIKIVNQLLNDPQFCNYFMEQFEVLDEFKEFILIDMKLPKDAPFCFSYVQWSLLMVFFNPLSQKSEPCCFVYALISNLINNEKHSDFVVKTLINALRTGKIFFEGNVVPIAPLINARITPFEKEFRLKLPIDSFSEMTAFNVARECVESRENLPNKKLSGKHVDDVMQLDKMVQLEFNSEANFAKKILFSLKEVYMQQLLFSIIQYMAINSTNTGTIKNNIVKFINYITVQGKFGEIGSKDRFDQFYGILTESFFSKICIVNVTNPEIKFQNDRVMFENHRQGFIFNGDVDSYVNFKEEARLLYIKEDLQYTPIDTITHFQQLLVKTTHAIISNLNFSNEIGVLNFYKYIQTAEFRIKIAEKIFAINKLETTLSVNDYLNSDSFFLIQTGGGYNFMHHFKPLDNKFEKQVFFRANNVNQFFEKLRSNFFIHTYQNKNFFKNNSSWILMESHKHSYNFCPLLIKKYLQHNGNEKLNININGRAIPIELLTPSKIRIILNKTLPSNEVDDLYGKICKIQSIPELSARLKLEIKPTLHSLLEENIDLTMNEIHLGSVKNNLVKLIIKITKFNDVKHSLKPLLEKINKYNDRADFISPCKLANIFFKILIKSSPSRYKSEYEIERNIRSFFSIPDVLKVANLNWKRENYQYLSIKYDFILKKLIFCKRVGEYDVPLAKSFAEEILNKTMLTYPK